MHPKDLPSTIPQSRCSLDQKKLIEQTEMAFSYHTIYRELELRQMRPI